MACRQPSSAISALSGRSRQKQASAISPSRCASELYSGRYAASAGCRPWHCRAASGPVNSSQAVGKSPGMAPRVCSMLYASRSTCAGIRTPPRLLTCKASVWQSSEQAWSSSQVSSPVIRSWRSINSCLPKMSGRFWRTGSAARTTRCICCASGSPGSRQSR